jgi:6-phosphogluconolactonase
MGLVAVDYIEKLFSWRITFTPHLINKAHEIIFLVTGSQKADILHRVLSTPPLPETLPAQAIHPLDGELNWFIDKDVSSSLDSSIIHTSSS